MCPCRRCWQRGWPVWSTMHSMPAMLAANWNCWSWRMFAFPMVSVLHSAMLHLSEYFYEDFLSILRGNFAASTATGMTSLRLTMTLSRFSVHLVALCIHGILLYEFWSSVSIYSFCDFYLCRAHRICCYFEQALKWLECLRWVTAMMWPDFRLYSVQNSMTADRLRIYIDRRTNYSSLVSLETFRRAWWSALQLSCSMVAVVLLALQLLLALCCCSHLP